MQAYVCIYMSHSVCTVCERRATSKTNYWMSARIYYTPNILKFSINCIKLENTTTTSFVLFLFFVFFYRTKWWKKKTIVKHLICSSRRGVFIHYTVDYTNNPTSTYNIKLYLRLVRVYGRQGISCIFKVFFSFC